MFLVGNVFFPDLYSFSFLENREEFKNHLIVSFCFSIMILHAIEQNKSSREAIVNHVCLTWHLSETYGQNCSDSSLNIQPCQIYLALMDQSLVKKYICIFGLKTTLKIPNKLCVYVCGMSTGMCAHVGVRYTIITMYIHASRGHLMLFSRSH